jgi:hypothetical protein
MLEHGMLATHLTVREIRRLGGVGRSWLLWNDWGRPLVWNAALATAGDVLGLWRSCSCCWSTGGVAF